MADKTRNTVVHLVPAMEQGGVETVVCDLNRELVRAGWRSVVMSRGGRLVERIVSDGGEHVSLDLKSKNPLTALSRAWRLRKAIRKIAKWNGEESRGGDRSDVSGDGGTRLVVCAHSRVPAWLFVIARKVDSILNPRQSVAGLPWITYAHGANSVSRYSAVMTMGDVVVAPSKFLKDFLIENYAGGGAPAGKTLAEATVGRDVLGAPCLRERIRVIYPAVDLDRFDPAKVDASKVAALRREWGVAEGERVVMSIGRITALKGFDNVIRDFAESTTPPTGKLVIVGGVDKGKEALLASLKKLAADLGVADRVVFAGQKDCIPECLAIADEVVSGNVTKPESFGLSVAEALAMNKPVRLLRRFGGAAEILDEVGRLCGEATDGRGATSTREAVRAMCSPQAMAKATLAAYAAARSRSV